MQSLKTNKEDEKFSFLATEYHNLGGDTNKALSHIASHITFRIWPAGALVEGPSGQT